MDTRTLAHTILELEARIAAAPQQNSEDETLWSQLLGDLIARMEPHASTRRSWRVPVNHRCKIVCEGRAATLKTINISHTGLGVEGEANFTPGAEGELILAEGSGASFVMKVPFRVVWCRPVEGTSRWQMGLEFGRQNLSQWHSSFHGWYLHAYTSVLRDLASGAQKVD